MRSSAGLASPILQATPSLKYIANRQVEDAANRIVNREVEALLRMPRLAFERIIVHRPKEAAPRRGSAPCRPLHAGCGGDFLPVVEHLRCHADAGVGSSASPTGWYSRPIRASATSSAQSAAACNRSFKDVAVEQGWHVGPPRPTAFASTLHPEDVFLSRWPAIPLTSAVFLGQGHQDNLSSRPAGKPAPPQEPA
jgi:hypothetical protein